MDSSSNRELIEQGFRAVNVRLDDMHDQMIHMHTENRDRLDKINGRVGRAHELIAVLQEAVSTLKAEFQSIRERWHKFRDSVQSIVDQPINKPDGDERPITRKELGWVIGLIVGSMAIASTVTIWILSRKP